MGFAFEHVVKVEKSIEGYAIKFTVITQGNVFSVKEFASHLVKLL